MKIEEIEATYYEYLIYYPNPTFITSHFPKLIKIAKTALKAHKAKLISCEVDENCASCKLMELFRELGEDV